MREREMYRADRSCSGYFLAGLAALALLRVRSPITRIGSSMMFGLSFSLLPLEGAAVLRADLPGFCRDFDFGFDLALMSQAFSINRPCSRIVSQVRWSVRLLPFISSKGKFAPPAHGPKR